MVHGFVMMVLYYFFHHHPALFLKEEGKEGFLRGAAPLLNSPLVRKRE